MKIKLQLITLALIMLWSASPTWSQTTPAEQPMTPARAQRDTDEIDETMRKEFLDPKMRGVDWAALVQKTRDRCSQIHDLDAFVDLVNNDLMAPLHISHTQLFAPDDPFYYFIASTFGHRSPGWKHAFSEDVARMPDPGFWVEKRAPGYFVIAVLEGGPAARAGLLVGDRIVSVDGAPWHGVDSFRGRVDKRVTIRVQRTADASSERDITLVPRLIDPQDAFLAASRESAHVVEHGGKKIAYYHIWGFSNQRVYEQAAEILHQRNIKHADALVLDIRDGIGGSYPELMYQFESNIPEAEFTDRNGHSSEWGGWSKPVVLLINERSRSSKELYAYAFKHMKIATLVGERTEGAVSAARAYFLKDGLLLYIAVSAVKVNGEVLEGKGVTPDVEVARPIPYCEGKDPQLERALDIAAGAR
jgi:carboxyl-terminal processing protease